jgi:hypothetical protein
MEEYYPWAIISAELKWAFYFIFFGNLTGENTGFI